MVKWMNKMCGIDKGFFKAIKVRKLFIVMISMKIVRPNCIIE